MYRLSKKHPAFQVTDGPFSGRTFLHGRDYPEIPPEEAHRFEQPEPVSVEQPESGVKKRTAKPAQEDEK